MEIQEAGSLPGSTLIKLDESNCSYVANLIKKIAQDNKQLLYIFNEDYVDYTIRTNLQDQNFTGFFTEHAVFIGRIGQSPSNPSVSIAEEWVWVSDGKDGLKVFKVFEKWASDQGASMILVNTNIDNRNEQRSRLMSRMGYAPNQISYIKWFI